MRFVCQKGYAVFMNDISETLKTLIKGDLDTSEESRELFSHDASMFEMKPQLIIAPKDSQDIQNVVSLVAQQKASRKTIFQSPHDQLVPT